MAPPPTPFVGAAFCRAGATGMIGQACGSTLPRPRMETKMTGRHAGAAFAIALALAVQGGGASAQGVMLAWGQSSDMIGWQTLAQLMAPAGDPTGNNVEFETWATDEDVYQSSPPR